MKFNEHLSEILNNFAQINPSIEFKAGNVISTLKPSGAILAIAQVDEGFDSSFAVYSLIQLLQILSQYDDPNITILEKKMLIGQGSGNEVATVNFCDPNLIATPPKKDITLPSVDVEFELSNDNLVRLKKMAAILGSTEINCEGDGQDILLVACNIKNSAENTFRMKIGTTTHKFRFVFLHENYTFLPRDYSVQISKAGLAHFKATDVEYWVAAEEIGTFFED